MSECEYANYGLVTATEQGPELEMVCRCIVCARCNKHTGNATQGHHWGWCKVTGTFREGHFCCPDDCELEAVAA